MADQPQVADTERIFLFHLFSINFFFAGWNDQVVEGHLPSHICVSSASKLNPSATITSSGGERDVRPHV